MARGQTIGAMVFNKPQLISLDALQPIVNYLSHPDRTPLPVRQDTANEVVELQLSDFADEENFRRYKLSLKGINPDTMVGTLDVSGALVYRKGSMGGDCTELTSYEGLKQQTQDMIDEGVKSIVMMVDSNGGMAYGMSTAANHIKKITKQAGVNLVAYVDGSCYSAAYGMSVVADELIINPQAGVGSVGVVVALYNDSKMLDKAGVTRQFVFAGENKIPFDNKTGEFTDKFIEDLQKSVDKTYSSFTKHVSSNRNLSEQAIIDTQASTYDAEEALQLGLVDKIMELEDFEMEYGIKTPKLSQQYYNTMSASDSSQPIEDGQLTKEGNMPDTKVVEPKADESLTATHATKTETGKEDMSLSDSMKMKLSELEGSNLELSSQLGELSSKLEQTQLERDELKETLQKQELENTMSQRKAVLEDALGKDNDKVLSLLESTATLSNEQFETIAQSLSGAQAEKQQQLSEFGGEGQESEKQLTLAEQMKQTAEAMKRKA